MMMDLFADKADRPKLTAADIRDAMRKRWAPPEYAVMWEVGEGTGAQTGRWADAVIMSLWPSRGLELHGVEIKVSRSDWKREAADPAKAEAIAQYCDRWYVHTQTGIIQDLSEVPPLWGLREYDGKAWRTIREAGLNPDVRAMTRKFLAALMRRSDSAMAQMVADAVTKAGTDIDKMRDEQRASYAKDVESAVARKTAKIAENSDRLAQFDAAFGDGGDTWYGNYAGFGKAARALADCGPKGWVDLSKRLRTAADEIEAIGKLAGAAE